MSSVLRFAAVACAIVMVLVAFQGHDVRASTPTGSEYNHALASNGGQATASGSTNPNTPDKANDGSTSTYWQSSTTTGYLSVAFRARAYVNEIHAHFLTVVYSKLSLYLDTNANGIYDSSEKVWSTTSNAGLNVIVNPTTTYALGMKLTVDGASGTAKPKIAEFEAYLKYDADGDGLTTAQETGTNYFQDVTPSGLPRAIPKDPANTSEASLSLVPFQGVPARALANFSIVHPRKIDLTAQVGRWNGTAWVDRYVWDPGKHLLSVGITAPDASQPAEGDVPVVATVLEPDITSKVEFRVDGGLQQTVTAPVGNEFRWTWPTSGDALHVLNATQYDATGARAWDQDSIKINNLAPSVSWVTPAGGSTVSGVVSVRATATDYYGIQKVNFYLDNVLQFTDTTPDPGTNDFVWNWDSSGTPLGAHTLKAIATDNIPSYGKSATSLVGVNVANDPSVAITAPQPNAAVADIVTVQATASSASSTISRVEFFVDGYLRATDTTAPYSWGWNTRLDPNGGHSLTAKSYRTSDGRIATATMTVYVTNDCSPHCPTGPNPSEPVQGGTASVTMGILVSDWLPGETDSGTTYTVVVDLGTSQSSASAAENGSRIFRPGIPLTDFMTFLPWRLVVRDWDARLVLVCGPDPPGPGGPDCWWEPEDQHGNVTAFTMRFEMKSDPQTADTDGDGVADGVEVNLWATLPVTRDSDLDGLSELYEITPHTLTVWVGGTTSILPAFTTNPALADTDGDGLTDGQERGFLTTGLSKVIGEVGRATGITGSCASSGTKTVFLRNRYTTAVVIAQPATKNEADTGAVRIKAVGDHSFDLCFQEWSGSSVHAVESVDYLVIESGNHILPDGSVVEAGRVNAGTAFATFGFRESFAQPPILLVQTESYTDPDVVAARARSVSAAGFDARIRVNVGDTHPAETVGYIALAVQSDPSVLATWSRGSLAIGASTNPAIVAFPKPLATAPRFLAWYATEGSLADLSLRAESVTNASATLQREISGTSSAETIAWFAFADSMNLTARMTTKPNGLGSTDTDGDTLADGAEVNTYGSNPALADSDADGIPDNVEVTSRTITIPVNGTAKTITFGTSPTSDDTDADGVKDPDELNGILDHRLAFYDMSTLSDGSHLRDLSGNGLAGTLSGPTNTTSSNKLKVGNALDFDGVNDKVSAGLPGMSGQPAWSFSLWFQWDNGAGTSSYQHLLGFGPGHDATVYMNKASLTLALKVTDGAGSTVVDLGLQTFTSTTSKSPHQVAVTFDGANLRAYVDGVAKGPWAAGAARIRSDAFRIGTSGAEASNYFDGRIDEVSVWDRALSTEEAAGYYNLTNGGGMVASLDMDTRTSTSDLFDFSGASHPGVATGTTVVEGRSGFARKLSGGTDGISLTGSASVTITSVTVDLYLLLSAYPTTDTALVARKGSFYLNVSSDGLARWSLYKAGSTASSVSIPLNRWVRITTTASASSLSLYLDGVSVASSTTASFPAALNAITLGYTEGQVHLSGALDQVLVLSLVASANTIRDLGVRGILLNPNGTDTDFDGLADGQELFVKSGKTPKRYPIPNQVWAFTDNVDLALGVPAWAIRSVDLMTGLTHPDMGQLQTILDHYRNGFVERQLTFRSYANVGEANNFTSYDLLNRGVVPSELTSGGVWYLQSWDQTVDSKKGQMEYMQLQVTAHTLPNRADTDGDGLSDSEEANLGSDGFWSDPWKVDTDSDGVLDSLEANGWTWSGSTIVASPSGFRTDPSRADTDRDGVRDGNDRAPLGDAFIRITFQSAIVYGGTDDDTTPSAFEPFASVRVGNQTMYTKHFDNVASGSMGLLVGQYVVNVPDDQTDVPLTVEVWDYDGLQANGAPDDTHERFAVSGASLTWTLNHPVAGGYQSYSSSGTGSFRAEQVSLTVDTLYASRIFAYMIIPSDYSGVYNVTNAAGSLTSRRYVGEPRLVPFVLNVTRVIPRYTWHYQEVIFVPRSVFFDTLLYKRLADRDASWPLTNLVFRQNGTSSSSNADDLQAVFSGNVTGGEEDEILRLLKLNTTGATRYQLIDAQSGGAPIPDTLFMFTLPDGALRLIGYTPFTVDSSVPYRFCSSPNCGVNPTPPTIWEQIWNGIVSTVTGWIVSAIVIAVNAFAKLVEVLAQVGSWLWTNLVGPGIAAVANAVRATAEALHELANWAIQWLNAMLDGVLAPFKAGLRNEGTRLVSASVPDGQIHETSTRQDYLSALWGTVGSGSFFNIVLAAVVVLQIVAAIAVNFIMPGGGSTVAQLVQTAIVGLIVSTVIGGLELLVLVGLDAVFKSAVPTSDPFWAEGAGVEVLGVIGDVTTIFINWERINKPGMSAFKAVKDLDAAWLVLSLAGLALTLLSVNYSGVAALGFSVVGVALAFIGAVKVLDKDPIDEIPFSMAPLKYLEEAVALISLGYALTDFARTASEV